MPSPLPDHSRPHRVSSRLHAHALSRIRSVSSLQEFLTPPASNAYASPTSVCSWPCSPPQIFHNRGALSMKTRLHFPLPAAPCCVHLFASSGERPRSVASPYLHLQQLSNDEEARHFFTVWRSRRVVSSRRGALGCALSGGQLWAITAGMQSDPCQDSGWSPRGPAAAGRVLSSSELRRQMHESSVASPTNNHHHNP